MDKTTIIGATVGLQSVALLGRAAKLLKRPKKKKPKRGKEFVKAGADILIGTSLIGATAGMINRM